MKKEFLYLGSLQAFNAFWPVDRDGWPIVTGVRVEVTDANSGEYLGEGFAAHDNDEPGKFEVPFVEPISGIIDLNFIPLNECKVQRDGTFGSKVDKGVITGIGVDGFEIENGVRCFRQSHFLRVLEMNQDVAKLAKKLLFSLAENRFLAIEGGRNTGKSTVIETLVSLSPGLCFYHSFDQHPSVGSFGRHLNCWLDDVGKSPRDLTLREKLQALGQTLIIAFDGLDRMKENNVRDCGKSDALLYELENAIRGDAFPHLSVVFTTTTPHRKFVSESVTSVKLRRNFETSVVETQLRLAIQHRKTKNWNGVIQAIAPVVKDGLSIHQMQTIAVSQAEAFRELGMRRQAKRWLDVATNTGDETNSRVLLEKAKSDASIHYTKLATEHAHAKRNYQDLADCYEFLAKLDRSNAAEHLAASNQALRTMIERV